MSGDLQGGPSVCVCPLVLNLANPAFPCTTVKLVSGIDYCQAPPTYEKEDLIDRREPTVDLRELVSGLQKH